MTQTRYLPTQFMEHSWAYEFNFEEDYYVDWLGFNSTTLQMKKKGWDIKLEYNRFSCKHKIVFREPKSGLITRLPFDFDMPEIKIDKLYASKSYRLRPAKFTEIVETFNKDMIPAMLEFIRASIREDIIDYVVSNKSTKDKVIHLGEYLLNHKRAA